MLKSDRKKKQAEKSTELYLSNEGQWKNETGKKYAAEKSREEKSFVSIVDWETAMVPEALCILYPYTKYRET